jgi:protein involved in polysaccharide export with SLBB domain
MHSISFQDRTLGLVRVWLGLGLVLLGLQGLAADPVKPPAEDKAKAEAESKPTNETLNAGDRVKVIISDIPVPQTLEKQIPESGELTLHLGHKFMFKGRKRDELEQEIRNFYIDQKIYRIINVTIEVPARPISVGGQVRSPGNYPHGGTLTVLKAIDMAGGFTDFAKRRKVKILRGNKSITVDCIKAVKNPELDVPIYPGDKIDVDKSIW